MSEWRIYNAPAGHNKKATAKQCSKCGTTHNQKRGVPCPFCGHIDKGRERKRA